MSEESIPEIRLPTEEEMRKAREAHLQRIRENKTCQSYWFPLLPADVPVPPTALVEFPYELQLAIISVAENETLDEPTQKAVERGISKVVEMCDLFGYPCFVKTGLFSDKHNWSCHVESRERVKEAVFNIVYSWACVGGMGTEDSNYIVVRRLIPTKAHMLFERKMPVTKERRYFAENGKVSWHQPYWPREAFPDWAEVDTLEYPSIDAALEVLNAETEEEVRYLSGLAESITTAIPGAWSIDFLQDVDGRWWLIDMAEAHKSYVNTKYEGGRKWLIG